MILLPPVTIPNKKGPGNITLAFLVDTVYHIRKNLISADVDKKLRSKSLTVCIRTDFLVVRKV